MMGGEHSHFKIKYFKGLLFNDLSPVPGSVGGEDTDVASVLSAMSAHERLAPPAAGGNGGGGGGDRTPEQAFRVPSAVPPSQQQTLADLTANWLKAQATLQMAHEAAQNGKSNGKRTTLTQP